MKLVIGNKRYSSWSFRPWLAMRASGISFDEELIPFDDEAGNPAIKAATPAGRVPVLVDGGLVVWDSLAILEYLAERFPEAGLWPDDAARRATARAMSAEMHSSFDALRNECPMNMARPVRPIAVSEAVHADVARIETLWDEALSASGGPFLMGKFGNVDAMFAPVVNRLEIYALSTHDAVGRYTAAMKALPAWAEWEAAGRAEPWIVEHEEV
ncbi:MAG: glutathione S-transferase family protein [Alphaproteobacteria bacterium]|nr:MAG: glutathione S-transferase family protein [Alphaproteobacteria bacterium]